MDLRLLGPIEARVDDRPIALGPRKQRALLAMLALQAGRTVSADRLAEGLWGEQQPASASKMVQLYVSQLRRLLDDDGVAILTRGRGYELRLGESTVDAVEFEGLLEQHRARDALALWRGEPLADVADEPFAAPEIRRLGELRVRAAEEAIDDDLDAGRHDEVIGEIEALVAEHPLREHLHAQRMLALYRAGRQADALNAYREARSVLVEQIGVEPGAELQRLQEAILAHDPALELASPPAEATPAPRRRRRRAAPVLAIAGLLLFAGILAFGISRLMEPDSLPGIEENHVGLIDAKSGRITAQYRVGHGPEAVAAGAGSVWVANRLDGTVARVDHGQQVATIDVGGEPTGLVYGAGSLWVADGRGRTVAQIDPGLNRVVQRFDVGNPTDAVAVGFGAVWVASAVDATVVKIDLGSGRVSKTIGVEARPTALAAGRGAIWVASDATARLIRLDPRSGTPVDTIAVGNGPSSVAVGAGAVWVANRTDGTVSRIDPGADAVTEAVPVGHEPRAVVAADDGVWVANGGDGTVMRIDPGDHDVTKTITTGGSPAALADVDGRVWAAAVAPTATHRGGTLRVSLLSDALFDPLQIEPAYALIPALLAYDGLVAYRRAGGSAGGTIVPVLAEDLPQESPDGLTYLFRLRPGIRYSNGAPLRPEDVRASIERMLMLSPDPDVVSGLPPIREIGQCHVKGCDLSKGIETDSSARTVTFRLSRPDPDFLHEIQLVLVVPAGSPARMARRRALPGTGPYVIKHWSPRRGGVLVRNPRFHERSPDRPGGFPDEIAFRIDRSRAQVPAVERGDADVALLLGEIGNFTQLRTRYGARLHTDPGLGLAYVFLNVRTPPFDDARVRQALNYAVDRGRVAELLGNGGTHVPTCQMLPPGMAGYTPACRFTVNPNPAGTWIGPDLPRARRLVAASGTQGMKVEFWGSRPWPQLGRYFRSLLTRLGYRGKLRTFDDLHLIYTHSAGKPKPRPQLGLWAWSAISAAPYKFLNDVVSCSGGSNLSRSCDRGTDALMRRAAGLRGPDAIELWRRVEASLAEQAATVPLVNYSTLTLTSERVGNYQYHPIWGPLVEQIWVR
jgi:peptide/nickel transport system substrate-binding protein